MLSAKLPAKLADTAHFSMPALAQELILWTTRDGREIPLDEMTDDHIANALRVLSVWRSRIKKQDASAPIVAELRDAIERFKSIQRQRRKALPSEDRPARPATGFGGRGLRTSSQAKSTQGKSSWRTSSQGKNSQGNNSQRNNNRSASSLGKRSLAAK
jgi:hypothetical protein